MVPVRQGSRASHRPTKELKRLLLEGLDGGPVKYRHAENQLLRWVLTNFAVAMDAAGNVSLTSELRATRSTRWRPPSLALDRAMRNLAAAPSVYENQGHLHALNAAQITATVPKRPEDGSNGPHGRSARRRYGIEQHLAPLRQPDTTQTSPDISTAGFKNLTVTLDMTVVGTDR